MASAPAATKSAIGRRSRTRRNGELRRQDRSGSPWVRPVHAGRVDRPAEHSHDQLKERTHTALPPGCGDHWDRPACCGPPGARAAYTTVRFITILAGAEPLLRFSHGLAIRHSSGRWESSTVRLWNLAPNSEAFRCQNGSFRVVQLSVHSHYRTSRPTRRPRDGRNVAAVIIVNDARTSLYGGARAITMVSVQRRRVRRSRREGAGRPNR